MNRVDITRFIFVSKCHLPNRINSPPNSQHTISGGYCCSCLDLMKSVFSQAGDCSALSTMLGSHATRSRTQPQSNPPQNHKEAYGVRRCRPGEYLPNRLSHRLSCKFPCPLGWFKYQNYLNITSRVSFIQSLL